ncbi:hypothetical protein JVT61DRAFT_14683 [Boletus reticuloceps]|uniref:Ubiquitin-like protease family profile domain-containing protein n=1 Tax=Boletus reticuloceps TaxID=495285 RepID=A0A8I2YTL6_9AGAM|nr:hypothetical protein JVT61DRAFT_14683 [Boletus reticuloceps]
MAVSVELLAFYRALFERSCDAINALAAALHLHYTRRGYRMMDKNGSAMQDPFRRSLAGDSPFFYSPRFFLPKSQVDAVGKHIEQARKRPVRHQQARVPDEAVNHCESTHEAADGKKQKSSMDSYDDTGLMALICHHDIPLFFANIDSPGEQQKYSIALIEHLFSLLPPAATVIVLYDIGCVIERLIAQRQRRLWLIDRQATAVATEMLRDLGDSSPVSVADLRKQWADQHEAQLSIRAHAPARLKKELDTVLGLQAELDACDRALQTARATIAKDQQAEQALDTLDSMERTHNRMLEKAEALYSSLNVQDQFPELSGVNLEFVKILLMARDLKINIRKREIGSFFEWDKLDRAVGGKDKALGTKLHQQTRKAIAKRQPALMSAIRKFNKYCEQLEQLYDPEYAIPLPTPLPSKLADLRSNQTLLHDVWITPAEGQIPRWLEDRDVRDGIRALLKQEHCQEEQIRLGIEADNMCRCFLLRERREDVLQLQAQWPTPLASVPRYESRACDAKQLANEIVGTATSSNPPLQWLPPLVCSIQPDAEAEDDTDPDVEAPIDAAEDTDIPPEQLLLADVLEASDLEDDEPEGHSPQIHLDWKPPENLLEDVFEVPATPSSGPTSFGARVRSATKGFRGIAFEAKDIHILANSEARLNDVCVNGCAALVYSKNLEHEASQVAVFSTHDFPRIRYHATDEDLWRNTSRTKFWQKAIWILPIHRPSSWGHWVLCSIHFDTHRLLLFDSLAESQPWENDLPVSAIQSLHNARSLIVHAAGYPHIHHAAVQHRAHPLRTPTCRPT